MRVRGVFWLAVLATAAAVLTAVAAGPAPSQSNPTDPSRCDRLRAAAAQRAGTVTGSGAVVLVLGDSWSAGWRLPRPRESWASYLPGRVFVDGFPGSGFSAGASGCGPVSFAARAAAAAQRSDPDLVVVQGGLNDVDQSDEEIAAGFAQLLAVLEPYDVVVVGPAVAPRRARAVPRVDRLLRQFSTEAGVPYIGTSDLDLPYLPDRLHLTAAGHRLFGDVVGQRLAGAS